jgi:RecJ-like exonuclease
MKLLFAALAAASLLCAADVNLGQPLTLKQPVAISALLAKPADYVGKTVQVKGKIAAVCQDMGCWMEITDDKDTKIRIKVKDGVIVFPKDSAGKTATAEGKFSKQDSGYQIDGTGAVIQGN